MTPQVAIVVSGFPRQSETFAINELTALADRGMLAGIYATKAGDGRTIQPDSARLLPLVERLPGSDEERQGAALAARLASRHVTGIHAYFAHMPAAVAEHAAARLGVPFGFSTHAKDARKVNRQALAERARRAACVVACNHDVAHELCDAGAPVYLVPHGVSLTRFAASPPVPGHGFRLLAVGRLVEKKGFDVLLDAVAVMDPHVTLRIVGEGPERERLMAKIAALELSSRVTLTGEKTHAQLPDEYAAADVVVVPSVVDASGDRDGLPNVVLEAMACGRPVIASRVGAIDAAVHDGQTGVLVPPRCPAAIADAVRALSLDRDHRLALGYLARREAERQYDLNRCADRFVQVLEAVYA